MIRTGDAYRASIRDGREVYINGERVADRVRLADAVGEADEVFVLQALSGG